MKQTTLRLLLGVGTALAILAAGTRAERDASGIGGWRPWLTATSSETSPYSLPNFAQILASTRRGDAVASRGRERWTQLTLELIAQYRLNPLRAARVLSIVHAAMHDALVRGTIEAGREDAAWISVHRAASLVLADLFPEESAERFEARGLVAAAPLVTDVETSTRMWRMGEQVARDAAMRAWTDGSDRVWPLDRRPPPSPGIWRPTPPINAVNPLEPLGGEWRPWVLASGGEVEPPPPPRYGSAQFGREVDEVRRVARTLTAAQKALAERWNLDRGTVTPAGVWNHIAVDLAKQAGLTEAETLRMLAAMNVAIHDAFIACWHAKYKWWTVRPISVIQEKYDASFRSHLITPPFPSYVSGHASASGGASAVLAHFVPAKAAWLSAQAEEAAESRLLGGIHYRIDNQAGLDLGRAVGARVIARMLGETTRGAPR